MKIFLDDIRDTPDGFIRTYTVDETINIIKDYNGEIEVLSLDNDLGENLREGKHVLKWIEEQAFLNELKPIPHLIIHSCNPVAVDDMLISRTNAWKYWTQHGYSRLEWVNKKFII